MGMYWGGLYACTDPVVGSPWQDQTESVSIANEGMACNSGYVECDHVIWFCFLFYGRNIRVLWYRRPNRNMHLVL
jgi:hypothetical protein